MIIDDQGIAVASLIVGAVSLIVSLGGFTIAVWQIRRTRSAAESAERAATEAREAVLHVTSVSDLSQITVQMELIRELHRNGEWTRAIDRYASLRRLLTEARSRLPEEAHDILNVAIIRLQEMEKIVNNALDKGNPISSAALNDEIVDIQQSLDEIRVWFENRMSGVSDAGGQQL